MVTTPLTVIRAQAGRLARELREAGQAKEDLPRLEITPAPLPFRMKICW